ncbi:hypothetical protein N7501_011968 [Penicillium viridicatum]|nr:hypothetical protein N7501_011968 [Penicillium viridicatum]
MTMNTSQSTQYVPPGWAHMLCELLALVQYTNIFWQNTGPAYKPELLPTVALSIQSLVRDFVNAVTAHRRAWRVSPTDIIHASIIHTPIKHQPTNQASLGYHTPVAPWRMRS